MIHYIVHRLLASVPVLIGIPFVTFALVRFLPGDSCRVMLGEKATDTICDQFVVYMREVFQVDQGQSFRCGRPVTQPSYPHAQYPPAYADSVARGGHVGHRHGDPGCGGALIPGARPPAAHGRVRLDVGLGAQPGLHFAAPGLLPRADDHADGVGV
jgi:hypothetical protein